MLFNKRTDNEHHAFSAGTWVYDKEGTSMHGKKLHEFNAAAEVLASLHELGIDAAENTRDQLSEDMVQQADFIIVMAEEHTIPKYLKNNPRVRYWEVQDPKGMTQEDTNKIRDQISTHVEELLSELEQKDYAHNEGI